jgi:hypothetical protein
MNQRIMKSYYLLKPLIPRSLQIFVRRRIIQLKRQACKKTWPIDRESGKAPENWNGWPGGKRFALVLTHDVDTVEGHKKCNCLVDIERNLGFRSSFNFVIKNNVHPELRNFLDDEGFEVGVHGLIHDRSLYESREKFEFQAGIINKCLKEWRAVGFRSPSMHHNLEWLQSLDIEYDASTFDTDPFEPQPDGMKTIFPFLVGENHMGKSYVELPYTLPQDFTLFILMQERSIRIWKEKLEWIAEKGGVALLNTHPDYMCFNGKKPCNEEYPSRYYKEFLMYVKTRFDGQFWHVLPREMASFWKTASGTERQSS